MAPRLLAAALALAPLLALAQATPIGLWKTIDDDTKKEGSLVRIVDSGGAMSGKVEKILKPDARPDVTCDKCTDDRKDKPVLGMEIIRGARKSADDAALWDGGEILDPGNGKTYKLRLKLVDQGRTLEVRGYIGTPLLGRTQTWTRVE